MDSKKRRMHKIIEYQFILTFLFFGLFGLAKNSNAATYYVTQSFQGTGNGLSYENSMSKAAHNASSFSSGDTIYLCGTFSEQIIPPSSGMENSPIVYRGDCPSYSAIFIFSGSPPSNSAIKISGKSYITVQNISVPHAYEALQIIDNSSHIIIDGVTAVAAAEKDLYSGIYVASGHNIIVRNCTVSGTYLSGIVFYGSETNPISDSIIENNTVSEAITNDGITIHESAEEYGAGSGNIIRNNVSFNNDEQGFDITAGNGTLIQNNVSYENGESGYVLWHSAENVIFDGNQSRNEKGLIVGPDSGNALIKNNYFNSTGYATALSLDQGSSYNVFNNTLIASPASSADAPLIIKSAVDNVDVNNNIVVSAVAGSNLLRSVHTGSETISYKNNCWYKEDGNGSGFYMWTGDSYSNYGFDDFSLLGSSADDIFSNPLLANDYIISSESPCVDGGIALSDVATDIVGTARPQGSVYDIGAYEYVSGTDLTAPTGPMGLAVN